MKYLSVCSGIEAATVAWHHMGWQPAAFAEIEAFPSAVLAHHYPGVQNVGDMTRFKEWQIESIDLLVGGTPCQAFSVAGLRGGLSDARGNLSLTFCEIADHYDPEWILWENVPGVLSSKDNAFGCFLAGLSGAGEPLVSERRWDDAGLVVGPKRTIVWRVLDAQYFGVAQRRRRVFVLAVRGAGNWAGARALFPVGEGVFWDSAPSRETREETAGSLVARSGKNGGGSNADVDAGHLIAFGGNRTRGHIDVSPALLAHPGSGYKQDFESETLLVQPVAFPANLSATQHASTENLAPSMGAKNPTAVAFVKATSPHSADEAPRYEQTDVAACLNTWDERHNPPKHMAVQAMQVRRLTPVECERLQGFPDGYTQIPWRKKPADECPDGPRYKALGNSMAVPVMRWIGERVRLVSTY